MHRTLAQTLRIPSLLLAAALQIMPIVRTALPAAQSGANVLAIIFRWAAGTAAALGGVHAVSGASTVVTSPLSTNIVQGRLFTLRLTTAPQQAGYWTATGLPAGISLTGTNGNSAWKLLGTPTVSGTFNVGLTAKSSASAGSSETTTATLAINISPAVASSPPAITAQPANLVITQGQNATFSVTVTGTAPLTYFWLKGAAVMTNGPNPSFNIVNAQTTAAGTYSVIVSNSVGKVTSSNATLTVNVPLIAPAITAQPGNQIVNVGQTATFSVTATGSAPLSYLWRKGTTVLTNSASPSFVISNPQTPDAGTYSVIVSNSVSTATSSNATLTVNVPISAPVITAQPGNQIVNLGQTATFNVTATGNTPLSYLWRKGATILTNSASPIFIIPNAQSTDAGTYSVIVSNSESTATSSNATLTVNTIIVAPGIGTQPPAAQLIFQGQTALFSVVATGTAPFNYQWRKNGANLTESAHFIGTLSNLFTINSVLTNDSGNYTVVVTNNSGSITSRVSVLIVTNITTSTLAVQVVGNGTVSPNYNGQVLTLGNNYTMTATPGPGYAFSKWTGSLFSISPSLTFVMQTNFILQANFDPAPVITLNGTYNGLFSDPNGASQLSSGFITVTVAGSKSFTGILQIGSSKMPLTGQFDANGSATIDVKRKGMNSLTVQLQLDLAGGSDQITGTVAVSDGSWTAALTANRVVFDAKTNPCPAAGTYTLLIPGTPGATGSPAGDGYGLVKVTPAGRVILTGTLADGTPFSQSTGVAKSGDWPLYAPLYRGRGSIFGWLTFTNTPSDDLHGSLTWIRPVQPTVALFNTGFGVVTEVVGSRYAPPPGGTRVLDFADGRVVLTDGNLAGSLTNHVQVNANNTVVNQDDQPLQLKIKAANGLMVGKTQNPATGKTLSIKGVVLQKQNAGGGYFLNQNQSGAVYFGP